MIEMVKTRAKGRNAELAFKKMMERAGWTVLLTPPPKKYNVQNDYFSLFDAICYKGKRRKYVQIKCNRKPPFKKYREWGNKYGNSFEMVEVWVRKDYIGWDSYTVWGRE